MQRDLNVQNAERQMQRAEELFAKQIISQQEYEDSRLKIQYRKRKLDKQHKMIWKLLEMDLSLDHQQLIQILEQLVSGTILEIPVKLGDQVIAANSFNAGTTVAIIADLSKMIFEGKVDEAEVGKLEVGQDLRVSMAAIPEKEFQAKLKFVAPKGTEAGGAVQFKIEADLTSR